MEGILKLHVTSNCAVNLNFSFYHAKFIQLQTNVF